MNTDTMGVYGNYYLKRAIVTQLGLGANLPEDAIYPLNLADSTGQPLDGAQCLYAALRQGRDAAGRRLLVGHALRLGRLPGRQSAQPLRGRQAGCRSNYNADGSLDLYFQNENPGADKEANWLPAPKGPFNLTMRLYAPRSAALTGKWNPPPVVRESGLPGLTVQ